MIITTHNDVVDARANSSNSTCFLRHEMLYGGTQVSDICIRAFLVIENIWIKMLTRNFILSLGNTTE